MAITYRLSEMQQINIVESDGKLVLELQSKFIKYHLILDDESRKEQMINLLLNIKEKEKKKMDEVKLPKFYNG
jgi:hypothetical protein